MLLSLGSVGPLGGISMLSASSGPLCDVLMGIVRSIMTKGMGMGRNKGVNTRVMEVRFWGEGGGDAGMQRRGSTWAGWENR